MKKALLVVVLLLFSSMLFAQKIKLSESKLKNQLDTILKEGNLLYKYAKSTRIAIDSALANPTVQLNLFWTYFTYEEGGQVKTIITVKNDQICVAEYIFEDDFSKPKSVIIERRELTAKERYLIDLQVKIHEQIRNPKYEVTFSRGYGCTVDFILIPDANIYKLFIIRGASEECEENIIPFGNDYLFIANKKGKIKSWQKFHSQFIPVYMTYDGRKVAEMTHSHIRTTPLITATDICTFKLYAPLYDIDEFSVYSPALDLYMKYNWKENKITVLPAE